MSKRSRDTLTGGTRDVSPQFLSFVFSQSGSDATTTTQQTLPVEKFGTAGNGARIIEVLKVYFGYDAAAIAEVDSRINVYLSTKTGGTTKLTFDNPTVFAYSKVISQITTSGQEFAVFPQVMDVTDGAGHGILIATDNIFAQLASSGTSATNTMEVKILYRFKQVGLQEYIGIVQSQQ
jgi:hypothetical protein